MRGTVKTMLYLSRFYKSTVQEKETRSSFILWCACVAVAVAVAVRCSVRVSWTQLP